MNFLKIVYLLFFLLPHSAYSAEIKLKMATIAPEGTAWMEIWKEGVKNIRKRTEGKVDFITFSAGVLGDEEEIVDLLKRGEIDLAGLTVHGISQIAPSFLVMTIPFQFQSIDEVNYIYSKLGKEFSEMFLSRNFEPLLFIDHGFVYAYSKLDISQLLLLKKARIWVWATEPSARLIFESMNARIFIPLTFQDVLPALKADLLDVVYTSPAVCVAVQWFAYTKYILFPPLRYEPAVLLAGPSFNKKLSPHLKKMVVEEIETWGKRAREAVLRDHETSLKELVLSHLQKIEFPQDFILETREKSIFLLIERNIVSPDLIKLVNSFLREYKKK